MIKKPHQAPRLLLQYEALDRRIPQNHHHKNTIHNQAKNLHAGYQGERSFDFALQFLDKNEFYIFHNLRLQDTHGFFQIDTLLISEFFALIIEVKNIHGVIRFDRMGQAIRTKDDGTEERFTNPLDQVQLQQKRFRLWLTQHISLQIPLEKMVVYTNPRTILKNDSQNKYMMDFISHKENLPTKVETLQATHTNRAITKKKINQLSTILLHKHVDDERNLMEILDIHAHELMFGVFCPECNALPMIRRQRKWYCSNCQFQSIHAHMDALRDYEILFGTKINNRQARKFLLIDSPHVTKRILMRGKFPFQGSTSDRVYNLSTLR